MSNQAQAFQQANATAPGGTAAGNQAKPIFRDLVCQHFRCTQERYEEVVFRQCVYRHAAGIARLIRWCSPNYFEYYFQSDLLLIRFAANATGAASLLTEIRCHRAEHPPTALLHRFLRVRLSGRRLLDLGDQLLSPQEVRTAAAPCWPAGGKECRAPAFLPA